MEILTSLLDNSAENQKDLLNSHVISLRKHK